jgi:soluble lytic murein transglycosylase-like protein
MAIPVYAPNVGRNHEEKGVEVSAAVVPEAHAEAVQAAKNQMKPAQKKAPVRMWLKKEEVRFHEMILRAARRHQVDAALIKAIIMAESGYNDRAKSGKGAKGLMQLMPGTAEALGVEDVFNPEHNINGGVTYFKKLLKQFKGDVKLALAAYNAGGRKVREYGGVPPFKSTRCYIKKISEYYKFYRKQIYGEREMASSLSHHFII